MTELPGHVTTSTPDVIDPRRQPWSSHAGLGSISLCWHIDDASARGPDRSIGLLPIRPDVGDTHRIAADEPFVHVVGDRFWCPYEGPDVTHAGYGGEMPRIVDIAFVRCRILELERLASDTGGPHGRVAAEVVVEELLTIPEMVALRPSSEAAPKTLWTMLPPMRRPTVVRQGDLVRVEGNLEGDCGAWIVLHDTAEATDILAVSEWGFGFDDLWFGKTRIRSGGTSIGPGMPPWPLGTREVETATSSAI